MTRVSAARWASQSLPGLVLCAVLGLAGFGIGALQARYLGRVIIEGLVAAILLGTMVRAVWTPPAVFDAGIRLAGRTVLETAVCLLGATVDLTVLLRPGPKLGLGIGGLVIIGVAGGKAIGRLLGLSPRVATLVACGNAICGNSAIAAVAPVIRAKPEQVASATAFTALVGVVVVLTLPMLLAPLGLSQYQYGVLAGLTVYAVPQVLAAAAPAGALAAQVAMLVKLSRVLLLGPVVIFFAVRHGNARAMRAERPRIFLPWFLIGFVVLAVARSAGGLPSLLVDPARQVSSWLTIGAMAAMGLGVDPRGVMRAGPRLALAVAGSLVVLFTLALTLIRSLGLP